jgi:hypothetical protein
MPDIALCGEPAQNAPANRRGDREGVVSVVSAR